jgi:hypothetical protein
MAIRRYNRHPGNIKKEKKAVDKKGNFVFIDE